MEVSEDEPSINPGRGRRELATMDAQSQPGETTNLLPNPPENVGSDGEKNGEMEVSSEESKEEEGEGEILAVPEIPRNASFVTTVANLVNGPLGAGLLSFPYTVYCTGLMTNLAMSTGVIILTIITLNILVKCQFITKDGIQSYQRCIEIHLGPFWRRILELLLLVFGTGVLVIYFVVIGQFIKPVVDVFVEPGAKYFYNDERLIITTFAIVFVYPLLLLREIKQLGFTSIISVFGSFYLVFFIVGYGIYQVSRGDFGRGIIRLMVFQPKFYPHSFYPILFLAMPMKCNGYICHCMMFPIGYELKKGSERKMKAATTISTALLSVIYISVGVLGFLAFGADIKDNILNNFSGRNVFANIGRAVIGMNLVFSLPIQHYSIRLAIMSFFWGSKKKRFGTVLHVLVTTVYFVVNLIAALFCPKLSVLFGFVGSVCTNSFMFLFPGLLCWVTLSRRSQGCWKVMWKLIAVGLWTCWVVFGTTGFAASVFALIQSYQQPEQ